MLSIVSGLLDRADLKPPPVAGGASSQAAAADEARLRGETSQRFAAAFGGVIAVLMQAPSFSFYSLLDLKWLVMPALTTGQFSLAQARSKETGELKPIAVVMWASVSDDVDKRLTTEAKTEVHLKSNEWRGGTHLWVVAGVGERSVVANQIRHLRETEWRGHPVKIKVPGPDGTPVVKVLSAA